MQYEYIRDYTDARLTQIITSERGYLAHQDKIDREQSYLQALLAEQRRRDLARMPKEASGPRKTMRYPEGGHNVKRRAFCEGCGRLMAKLWEIGERYICLDCYQTVEERMENAIAVRPNSGVINFEDYAMPVESLVRQVGLIRSVMDKVMKEDEHYGKIPGTNKPTLLKPGAEKLCLTFRLDPDYEIIREVRDRDFIAYTVKCGLTHIPTGQAIASGIGSCNSREAKYRYRHDFEMTDTPVPKGYWDARRAGNSQEMKRLLGPGFIAKKNEETGQWVLAKSQKAENDNPWDLDNTIVKMACKRALIAAVLNATAASDIFTQDVEDLPQEMLRQEKPERQKKERAPQNPQDPAAIRRKKLADLSAAISEKAALMGIDQDEGYEVGSFIRQTMGLHLGRTIASANDITNEEIDDYLIASKEEVAA